MSVIDILVAVAPCREIMLAQSSNPAGGLSAELLSTMVRKVGKVLRPLSQQEKKTNHQNFPEAERTQKKGKNNVIKQISHSALMVFRQACVCFSTSVVRSSFGRYQSL